MLQGCTLAHLAARHNNVGLLMVLLELDVGWETDGSVMGMAEPTVGSGGGPCCPPNPMHAPKTEEQLRLGRLALQSGLLPIHEAARYHSADAMRALLLMSKHYNTKDTINAKDEVSAADWLLCGRQPRLCSSQACEEPWEMRHTCQASHRDCLCACAAERHDPTQLVRQLQVHQGCPSRPAAAGGWSRPAGARRHSCESRHCAFCPLTICNCPPSKLCT